MLRTATAADAELFAALDADLFGPQAWSLATYHDELASPYRYYVAAEDDGRVVGYAGLGMAGEDSEIMTIATVAGHQRRGVGQALLDALIANARSRGAEHVFLEVAVTNEPALALYRRNGFEVLATRRRYYGETDAYTMVLGLTS